MIKAWGKEVIFKKYPNGELMIDFKASGLEWLKEAMAMDARGEHIDIRQTAIEFKWEDDSDLIKLMLLKEYIGYPANELIIYQMPYGRADRSENGSPFMLKYVAEFINLMMFNKVRIVEPHSQATIDLLDNSEAVHIIGDLLDHAMETVDFNGDVDYIVFPDMGSANRYNRNAMDAKGYNTMFFVKERDFETGEIKGLRAVGGPKDDTPRKAIIIDDLTSYGGTFHYSALQLKDMGFDDIHLVVAHAEDSVLEGEIIKPDHPIQTIFTTDSMFTMATAWTRSKHEYCGKLDVASVMDVVNRNSAWK